MSGKREMALLKNRNFFRFQKAGIRPVYALCQIVLLSSLVTGCPKEKEEEVTTLVALALIWQALPGPTYYVDATSGSDSNSGLSTEDPWQTIQKVNSSTLSKSTVLFKRGEVWRGQLIPKSGNVFHNTFYSAYGSGSKPTIIGSVNRSLESNWTLEAGNVWRSAETFETDIGNIIFNDGAAFGQKKWSSGDLSSAGDYYYDRSTGYLYLYSTANPAASYSSIELALRQHIVDQHGRSYITYENLSLKYGGASGFDGGETQNITIRDCDVSYTGGGDLNMDGSNIRFGNGIAFWGNATNHLVERNRIWEIYDTGLSNQNHTRTVTQSNIVYRNNIVWNCAMACFEYWNRPSTSVTRNIRFEHNTCVNAGSGWGAPPQRPDLMGVQFLLTDNPPTASEIYIRNNIAYGGNLSLFIKKAYEYENSLTIDGNCYYKLSGNMIQIEDQALTYSMAQFADYQSFSGQEQHSTTGDPLFNSIPLEDFRLQSGSPCRNSALDLGAITDFEGTRRPTGSGFDMGAYEQ